MAEDAAEAKAVAVVATAAEAVATVAAEAVTVVVVAAGADVATAAEATGAAAKPARLRAFSVHFHGLGSYPPDSFFLRGCDVSVSSQPRCDRRFFSRG